MNTPKICALLTLAALSASPMTAFAQGMPKPLPAVPDAEKAPVNAAVAIRISTLGLGLEASKLVNPNIALRIGLNSYSYNHNFSSNDIDYSGHLRLRSISALGDFYPGQHTGFHVSAGVVFNNNKISGSGQPNSNGTITINGTDYTTSLNGDVTFPNKVAPYLGIGIGKPSEGGAALRFLLDVGVIFQGKPRLSLTASNPLAANDVRIQRDKSQSDVNKFNVYPVISLGIGYHFK